ncbi:hypothetical protein V8G54_024697 [Vigna mungo]|uniref:Uncharacterized protein n=1 Tax=Vigna mungo TaxID=3915 RepID=A0AAQ3N7N1_VIGMU
MGWWQRGHTTGRGSSATVSTATCCAGGAVFAVKSVELSQSESLKREQKILSSVSSLCGCVQRVWRYDGKQQALVQPLHGAHALWHGCSGDSPAVAGSRKRLWHVTPGKLCRG